MLQSNKKINIAYVKYFIVIILVLLIYEVFGVCKNCYISYINDEYSSINNLITSSKGVYLPTWQFYSYDELFFNSDGSIQTIDGKTISKDGTVKNKNGVIIMENGASYINNTLYFPDNSILYNNGLYVNSDKKIKKKLDIQLYDNFAIIKDEKIPISEVDVAIWDKTINSNQIDYNVTLPTIYNDNVFNILIAGVDYGDYESYISNIDSDYKRSDSIIILSINKYTKSTKIISLSRAVLTDITGFNKTRLNMAYQYGGIDLLKDTIMRNYHIRIDRYLIIDFEIFKEIIDCYNGIDIDLSEEEADYFVNYINKSYQNYVGAGTYHFDGEAALIYARLREIDSDRNRTYRQQKIISELKHKVFSINTIFLLNYIYKKIETDISFTDIVKNINFYFGCLTWNSENITIPHQSSDLIKNDDGYEVLLVYWPTEIKYIREIIYGNLPIHALE